MKYLSGNDYSICVQEDWGAKRRAAKWREKKEEYFVVNLIEYKEALSHEETKLNKEELNSRPLVRKSHWMEKANEDQYQEGDSTEKIYQIIVNAITETRQGCWYTRGVVGTAEVQVSNW